MSFKGFFETAQQQKNKYKKNKRNNHCDDGDNDDDDDDSSSKPNKPPIRKNANPNRDNKKIHRVRSNNHPSPSSTGDDGGGRGSQTRKRPRSSQQHNNNHQKRHRQKQPLSEEARILSSKLKELCQRKKMNESLRMYWDRSNANVRDQHHACIVIDCCSRCCSSSGGSSDNNGAMIEAEKIINSIDNPISVVVMTALMKGYAHSGNIPKAESLFVDMCSTSSSSSDDKNKYNNNNNYPLPNIRTFNTVLRGCLWSPVVSSVNDEKKKKLAGGVITSERIWELFCQTVGNDALDLSSYEYSITILCQALQTDAAEKRILELQNSNSIRMKGKASFVVVSSRNKNNGGGGEGREGSTTDKSALASVFESLAGSYLALSRAYAFQGRSDDVWTACQRALNAVNGSRRAAAAAVAAAAAQHLATNNNNDDGNNNNNKGTKKRKKITTTGGKQSWKKTDRDDDTTSINKDARRTDSNTAFRGHRLTEFEMEARRMLKERGNNNKQQHSQQSSSTSRQDLLRWLMNQLLYFPPSAEGDTASNLHHATTTAKNIDIEQFRLASWYSYGGSTLYDEGPHGNDDESLSCIQRNLLRQDGSIDFDKVFSSNNNSKKKKSNKNQKPVDIELGAGFGDWIVGQAHGQPSRNYVSVEIRSDRVYQTFAKATFEYPKPLENLCVVGCDAGSFLCDRVKNGTISTIFVNHPEPPTQTYGEDRADIQSIIDGSVAEPAHMLCSSTLVAAAQCLEKKDGKLVIVTDNRWYARLVCATLVRAARSHPQLLRSLPATEAKGDYGLRHVESFHQNSVVLYQRESSSSQATNTTGLQQQKMTHRSTWFDRLWRTGAGSHAERTTRFVIIMHRGK